MIDSRRPVRLETPCSGSDCQCSAPHDLCLFQL